MPDAASRKAPVHTDAVRRARLARSRTQSINTVSVVAAATPSPPAITSVSKPASVGESVGRCEHLDWSGDIEQLYGRIGQDFDNATTIWRKTRGFWHHRQKMPR